MKDPAGKRPPVSGVAGHDQRAARLGHFDLSSEEMSPMPPYRVAAGTSGIVAEQLEDLLETAIGECERFTLPSIRIVGR
jgi:hypothetical protein